MGPWAFRLPAKEIIQILSKNQNVMNTHQPTHDEIAERAREIWNSEGQPAGRDDEIWLTAEQQLRTPKNRVVTAPRTRGARAVRATTTAKERPSSLEEEADPIANDKLEDRLSNFGAPGSRGATSL